MATVIESLLVQLGFRTDPSGAAAFQGQLDGIVGKVAGFAALLGSFASIGSFVETASQFEKFEVQLTTIQGSAEKAKESLSWIAEFAAKTPYDLAQVTEGFVKLQAYGLDPIKGNLLESIGNMASGMNKSLDQAVEAIADAMTGENERLKEFGIRSEKKGEMFTYTYNLNGEEVKVQAKNEAKSIQAALQQIMDARFAGGMERMSKTWEGTLARLVDVWGMVKLKVMSSGPFEMMKDSLNGFMDLLDKNKSSIDYWAAFIGNAITRVVNVFSFALVKIKDFSDEAGLTEPIVTALGYAATYTGLALLGMASGGLIKATLAVTRFAVASLVAMWPFALLGAAIAAVILMIDDFLSYQKGEKSVIGDLIGDYPIIQKAINGLSSIKAFILTLIQSARELWSEMTIAFGAFDTGESLAVEMRNAVGFAFDSIGKAVSAVAPIIGFFIYLLGMVARGWILIGATAAGFIAELIQGLVMIVSYIVGAVANAIQAIINFFMVDIPNAARKLVTDTLASWQELASKAESLIPDWLRNLFSGKSSTVSLNVSGGVPAGALAGFGGAGGVVINNSTSVTVPTAAGAAQVAREANSGAAQRTRSAGSGVAQ